MTHEPIDLDAIQALTDAATPGPWTSWRKIPGVVRIETTTGDALVYHDPVDEDGQLITESDAEFITQARTLVPALIAELRETRAERDGYKARGRVYEGKVQTLRDDIRAALAKYDVTPTLKDFNAALEGGA